MERRDAEILEELKMREQINELMAAGRHEEIRKILLANRKTSKHAVDLKTLFHLIPVCDQEKNAGQPTLFEKTKDLETLMERYTKLKFYLRRIEFGIMDDGMSEFKEFLALNAVSAYELLAAIQYNVLDQEKVLKVVQGRE